MNAVGATIMIVSGGLVLFTLFTAFLGMNLRLERNIFRSIVLEWLDRLAGKRGRHSMARAFSRAVIGIWRPVKLTVLRISGIDTQAMALQLSRQALYLNMAVTSLAVVVLFTILLGSDLTNKYMVSHSSSELPLFFRLTALWAGSSGSLLFWYFLLVLFSTIAVYQTRDKLFNRLPVLYMLLGFLQLIFIALCLFFPDAQPFRQFPQAMAAGRGINPLLLHWAMIIHPPILYVGYVSFAIPFAIAMSAVITGNMRNDWLPLMRRWSLFAWFFLGTGILLGSKWAYEELGWGGYWAWDPVENASLMPFLLATAFIHSLIVQERRGMLRFWNVILISAAYHMCLVGTWVTRSGVLQGPHSFANSDIGYPLITFIIISFIFSIRYIYFRRHQLKPERELENVTSKEGSMLLNNFFMTLSMLIIMAGVFSPLLPFDCGIVDGSFSCHTVQWKQSAYNRVMVPIGVITLFLMGASPLLSWRKDALSVWKKTLRIPLAVGIIGGTAFALSYGYFFTGEAAANEGVWGPAIVSEVMSILVVGIACFTLTGIIQEYAQGVHSRRVRFEENTVQALIRLVLRNKRRYGGYLVHLSILFLFVGYAGSAFKVTKKFEFHYYRMPYQQVGNSGIVRYYSGDKAYLENYEIEARDLFFRPVFKENADPDDPIYFTISHEAHYHIQRGTDRTYLAEEQRVNPTLSAYERANRPASAMSRLLKFTTGYILDGRMKSERHFHPRINTFSGLVQRNESSVAERQPTSEPDIRSTWNEDVYIQLGTLFDPVRGVNPDINHAYELYFYGTDRSEFYYTNIFPPALVASLEVWINPLVKFIWLGSILFFLSGLLLLVPYGERDLGD